MGNCQATEAAAVLIQHPGGGRTERAYWALSAGPVMAANPGHYVAAVIATTPPPAGDAASASAPVKHLKLLRPDDTLLLGRVYRLVSFEGTHRIAIRPTFNCASCRPVCHEQDTVLGRPAGWCQRDIPACSCADRLRILCLCSVFNAIVD